MQARTRLLESLVVRRWAGLAAAGVAALVGCGGPFDSTVTGVVTLEGKPVPTGTVTFIPQSAGPSAYGIIDSDGRYSLRVGREEGLPSGQYSATVLATEESTTPGKDGGPPPMGKAITPSWYAQPNLSGLNRKVDPGDNEINLELTSTPPPGWKPPGRGG